MGVTLPILAGMASTAVFVASVLPMLCKAARTRDLSSYSLGNIVLANIGNAVHSVYVFHLPPGPIWFLHTFYVVSSALMLYWYLRPGRCVAVAGSGRDATLPFAAGQADRRPLLPGGCAAVRSADGAADAVVATHRQPRGAVPHPAGTDIETAEYADGCVVTMPARVLEFGYPRWSAIRAVSSRRPAGRWRSAT